MFRVIIAGSRSFDDYELLVRKMDMLLQNITDEIAVVCGEARGADTLGKRYALERGYRVLSYPADWDTYGKRAGYMRNITMAENADALVAFWDGESRGTKHMIDIARQYGLSTRIIRYEQYKEINK